MLRILVFHQTNHKTVLPQNHLLEDRHLLADKHFLSMITETDSTNLLTIVLHLAHQTTVVLLFTIQIFQYITRILLLLDNITQAKGCEDPHGQLLHFLW